MKDPVERVARTLSRRSPFGLVVAQFGVANVVAAGGLGLLPVYQRMSLGKFAILLAVSQAVVTVDNVISFGVLRRLWRPVREWTRGRHDDEATIAAWTVLVTLPVVHTRRMARYPILVALLPFCAFACWLLKLSWYDLPVIGLGSGVVLACGAIVRFFGMELAVRPLLEEVSEALPPEYYPTDLPAIPIRLRLLAAAPIINVITAVVVAGLSNRGQHLSDLGVAVLVAVGVSFTISLELVLLVARSMLTSLDELQEATARVAAGDYEVRMPVASADEVGELAHSFNTMVEGLDERERLRAAFGAYVDPSIADRVLEEGADLEGEELEVTVLFLDIRDFTSFSERVRPHELVGFLSRFWELVVPILLEHGGHANKFIGDGLLGVFGAPERIADHAQAGVEAAIEIARLVRERYRGRIAVGIGVNTGRVVAGTVGGGGRMEFTVIGDAVNTAARVEAATRETGDDILITEATRERLGPVRFEFEERPPVPLKGKRAEVRLYALRDPGGAGGASPDRAAAVAD
jgi:class 3 adenylate cyclase